MSAALKSVFWFGVVVSGGYVIMRAGTPDQADVLKVDRGYHHDPLASRHMLGDIISCFRSEMVDSCF